MHKAVSTTKPLHLYKHILAIAYKQDFAGLRRKCVGFETQSCQFSFLHAVCSLFDVQCHLNSQNAIELAISYHWN